MYYNIHPFNGPLSGTTRVSRYQKGKTNLDFTEARESEWQWHQLGHMQVCTLLQTDNHASAPPLRFLQAGCPSCRPTNSVKALKADYVLQLVTELAKTIHCCCADAVAWFAFDPATTTRDVLSTWCCCCVHDGVVVAPTQWRGLRSTRRRQHATFCSRTTTGR